MKVSKIINTGMGIITSYSGPKLNHMESAARNAVDELNNLYKIPGQQLGWVELPAQQLKRIDVFYDTAKLLKQKNENRFLTVVGIGGSKHPVEHMLSINGLNLDNKIKFFSDIDTTSYNRYKKEIGGDITNSNFLVVSKSGTTFETKYALEIIEKDLTYAYRSKGLSSKEAQKKAATHFVAVTDPNPQGKLRQHAIQNKWDGEFFIHKDVGGRFSAFDDHTLFALAYSDMPKAKMIEMLIGANKMSKHALQGDLTSNDPLAKAAHWVNGRINKIQRSTHLYMGAAFDKTPTWHTQMNYESIKDMLRQFLKVPEGMHHSAETHYNKILDFVSGLTSYTNTKNDFMELISNGKAQKVGTVYVDALNTSYSKKNLAHFHELVEGNDLGLAPESAGAMTQSRAFETVYEELIEKAHTGKEFTRPLEAVEQPNVETYKSVLREKIKDL